METKKVRETPKQRQSIYGGILCKIWGYYSGTAEVSTLLRHYIVTFKL